MRLFLDAHISARRVARALRRAGHDVRAVDEERALDGTSDEDLLAMATAEDRVMVTFDVGDFARIARRWAQAGQPHAGCAVVVGIDHGEFGTIIRSLRRSFEVDRPDPEDWRDHLRFVRRDAPP